MVGFIMTPRSTNRPIDHKICGRFNASIYAGTNTTTYYLNKNHMQLKRKKITQEIAKVINYFNYPYQKTLIFNINFVLKDQNFDI